MYNTNYGGYQFPQLTPMPPMPQSTATRPQIIGAYVNGVEGARAYDMGYYSTAILINADAPTLFLKVIDANGLANIEEFVITKKEEEPAVEYATNTPKIKVLTK